MLGVFMVSFLCSFWFWMNADGGGRLAGDGEGMMILNLLNSCVMSGCRACNIPLL